MGKTWGLVCLFLACGALGAPASDSLTEWITVQERIGRAVARVQNEYKKNGLRLGLGWWGNVSKLGPPCDDVAYKVEDALADSFRSMDLRHFKIVLLFDAGVLPKDLLAHVYFGVASKRSGRLLYCFDPWRYGDGRLRDYCPNSVDEMHTILE
ncbi:MAG: hypothetical protein KDD51_05635 [Bdellovibrionales bacterium]|nr:hypothetical protein [Bdellovibrionales bacterium]